jgi:hypothetical protein
MYSAGVNAALAAFFGIADIDNILQSSSNISSNTPSRLSNIPSSQLSTIPDNAGTIPHNILGNTPSEALAMEAMPGK